MVEVPSDLCGSIDFQLFLLSQCFLILRFYFLDVLKSLTRGMESIESDSGGLTTWTISFHCS